jgi:hypothetical protein
MTKDTKEKINEFAKKYLEHGGKNVANFSALTEFIDKNFVGRAELKEWIENNTLWNRENDRVWKTVDLIALLKFLDGK